MWLAGEHEKRMSPGSNCSSLKAIFHNMHRKLASKLNEICFRFFFSLSLSFSVCLLYLSVSVWMEKDVCIILSFIATSIQIPTKADNQSALFVYTFVQYICIYTFYRYISSFFSIWIKGGWYQTSVFIKCKQSAIDTRLPNTYTLLNIYRMSVHRHSIWT